jgi:hypothetical protein
MGKNPSNNKKYIKTTLVFHEYDPMGKKSVHD